MMIIGCDYHPSWQQICWLDTLTGETGERSWSMRRVGRGYEERFLSAQANRFAGAHAEERIGLLRSVPQNHPGCKHRIPQEHPGRKMRE